MCKGTLDGTHTRTIRSLAWSPNGRYLASCGFDGLVAVWENQDGEFECIASLEGQQNEVKGVAWSPSGALLASCSRDKSIWIWSADADNEFECVSVLHGHTQDVKAVRFHPTEDLLVSASYDNSIKTWMEEDDDWYCQETMNEHKSTVWSLCFNASGDKIASVSDDLSVVVWERAEAEDKTVQRKHWRKAAELKGFHKRTIFTVDWSTEGFLVTGGSDDSIQIFVAANGSNDFKQLLAVDKAHESDVNCVSWHPHDPSLLASAGDDHVVKIWRFSPGDPQGVDSAMAM